MNATELTPEQTAEMQRIKSYFPYRIVYGAVKDGEWQCGAVTTKREPNRLAREGWTVFLLGK